MPGPEAAPPQPKPSETARLTLSPRPRPILSSRAHAHIHMHATATRSALTCSGARDRGYIGMDLEHALALGCSPSAAEMLNELDVSRQEVRGALMEGAHEL